MVRPFRRWGCKTVCLSNERSYCFAGAQSWLNGAPRYAAGAGMIDVNGGNAKFKVLIFRSERTRLT